MRKSLTLALACALFAAPAGAQTDTSKWIVSGVTLGDDYEKLFESYDKNKALIEMRGYSVADRVETMRQIWVYDQGQLDQPVDVIWRTEFQISDGQIFIQGEADGEGRITELLFRQKAEGSGEARLKQLTERYGSPHGGSGGTYTWGCETPTAPCLEAEPKDWQLEVRMRDAGAKSRWMSQYRAGISAAKGESSADRF